LLTDRDNEVDDGTPKVSMMTIHLAKGLEFPYVYIVGLEENLFPSMMSSGSRSELEEERRLFYVALTRAEKRAHLTYAHTRYRWGKLIDCEPSRFIDEIDETYLDIQIPEFAPTSFSSSALNNAFGAPNEKSKGRTVYQGKNKNLGKPSSAERKGKKINPVTNAAKNPKLRGKTLTPVNNTGAGISSGDFLKPNELHEGKRVVHGRFGLGTVVRMEGEGADAKAIINFDNAGEKRLLLKFAKVSAA